MGALLVGTERRLDAAVLVVGDGGLVSHFAFDRIDWLHAQIGIDARR